MLRTYLYQKSCQVNANRENYAYQTRKYPKSLLNLNRGAKNGVAPIVIWNPIWIRFTTRSVLRRIRKGRRLNGVVSSDRILNRFSMPAADCGFKPNVCIGALGAMRHTAVCFESVMYYIPINNRSIRSYDDSVIERHVFFCVMSFDFFFICRKVLWK